MPQPPTPPPFFQQGAIQGQGQATTLITQVVQQYNSANGTNVDPNLAIAVASVETGGTFNSNSYNPNNANGTQDYGLMQINSATIASLAGANYPLSNLYDPSTNVWYGTQILSQALVASNQDVGGALAYYNGGTKALASYQAGTLATDFPTVNNYVNSVCARAGVTVTVQQVPGAAPSNQPSDGFNNVPLNHLPTPYSPLLLSSPTVSYQSLFPDAIINTNLDNTPWYADTGLVTGNPKVRGSVTPVTFEVMLHDRQDVYLPVSPVDATSADRYPHLQVQLNASMKTFSVNSRHVVTPQRSRTGWHVTMWGMQADMIEGSCSTGVFMNQTGLTDFFSTSTSGISADVIQALSAGFKYLQMANVDYANAGGQASTGAVAGATVQSSQADFNQMLTDLGITSNQPFRVAAQDAFVEFLSLFKMNGIRWFYNKDFEAESGSGQGQAKEQVDIDAWSPELGITATQLNGRMNDVMSRGAVLMKFKGTTYLGYFKSLNWNQDAQNPFRWDFNFVFQVEKTYGFVFNPTG
jgi:hypothetical protein